METWGYEYAVRATEQGIGTKQGLRSFGQAQGNLDFQVPVVLQAPNGSMSTDELDAVPEPRAAESRCTKMA